MKPKVGMLLIDRGDSGCVREIVEVTQYVVVYTMRGSIFKHTWTLDEIEKDIDPKTGWVNLVDLDALILE